MYQRFLTLLSISILVLTTLASSVAQDGDLWENFPYDNFDDSTTIDNPWLPYIPGMRFTYEGSFLDEGEEIERRVITTVTDLSKEIDGITALVIWDQDYDDDELVETEIAFFAQDNDGNIWRMGEHPEEYEDGEFVEAPTWIAGQDDAHAGILVPGTPELETADFSQGYVESVDFTDRAFVFAMGEELCIELGCYEDVLIIDEFNPEEEDAFQQKYYAPDVGNIFVGWRGEGEEEQEEMELIAIDELDEEAMAEAREAAFALEAHAYEVSAEVYGETAPMQQMMAED
jgi:hypothetical protein